MCTALLEVNVCVHSPSGGACLCAQSWSIHLNVCVFSHGTHTCLCVRSPSGSACFMRNTFFCSRQSVQFLHIGEVAFFFLLRSKVCQDLKYANIWLRISDLHR